MIIDIGKFLYNVRKESLVYIASGEVSFTKIRLLVIIIELQLALLSNLII